MKKLSTVLFFLILTVSILPLFADKLEFSIKWILDNTENTTLEVLDYNGNDTFNKVDGVVDDVVSFTPETDSTYYPVCLVRYTTNKRGLSYIVFEATPLIEVDPPQTLQFEYKLIFGLKGAEYPLSVTLDGENVERLTIQLLEVGTSVFNITVNAIFTDLDIMPINSDNSSKQYRSTLTIRRSAE